MNSPVNKTELIDIRSIAPLESVFAYPVCDKSTETVSLPSCTDLLRRVLDEKSFRLFCCDRQHNQIYRNNRNRPAVYERAVSRYQPQFMVQFFQTNTCIIQSPVLSDGTTWYKKLYNRPNRRQKDWQNTYCRQNLDSRQYISDYIPVSCSTRHIVYLKQQPYGCERISKINRFNPPAPSSAVHLSIPCHLWYPSIAGVQSLYTIERQISASHQHSFRFPMPPLFLNHP